LLLDNHMRMYSLCTSLIETTFRHLF